MTDPAKTFVRSQLEEGVRAAYTAAVEAQVAVNNYLAAAREAKDYLTTDEFLEILMEQTESARPVEGMELVEGQPIFATILETLTPLGRTKQGPPPSYQPPSWDEVGRD